MNKDNYSNLKFWMKVGFNITILQILFLTTVLAGTSTAQVKSLDQSYLSVNFQNAKLKEVFRYIEHQTDYKFGFDVSLNSEVPKISLVKSDASIRDILTEISKQTNLSFRRINNSIDVRYVGEKNNERVMEVVQETITGKITDERGDGLPGATVQEKGTTNGTTTDIDGSYKLITSTENPVFIVSFVGYTPREIEVGSNTQIDVSLELDNIGLEEVVVTALGVTQKKKSLGYTTTKISGDAVSLAKESNFVNSLSGKVAGLVVSSANTGMGGSSRVIIRGNSSIGGDNQPLYVVDGIPIDNSGFGGVSSSAKGVNWSRTDFGTGISDINPADIESISVLNGPNAAALYGSRAANGVILITTKKGRTKQGVGVSFTSNLMVNSVNSSVVPDFQNVYGQGDVGTYDADSRLSHGGLLDGSTVLAWDGLERTYQAYPDNVEGFLQDGVAFNNTVTFDAGRENGSMRFSYSNLNETGIVPNSSLKRHNFTLRSTMELSDRLSVDGKVTYFLQEGENRLTMGWSNANIMRMLYQLPRSISLQELENYELPDGSSRSYAANTPNPYWQQYKETNEDFRRRLQGFAKVNYEFSDWLSAFARIGTDFTNQSITRITPYGHFSDPLGNRQDLLHSIAETNADFLFMFDKDLGSDLNLQINAGGNYRRRTAQTIGASGGRAKIPTADFYNNYENKDPIFTSPRRTSIYSAYVSGTLGFRNYAYLNFSGRNDWSSDLWTPSSDKGDYSYFYPSVSLSLLGNEAFNINSNILSFSKLRLSWSEVGSGGFKTDDVTYSIGAAEGYNGTISVVRTDIKYDEKLKSETTRSIELGTELKFLNNRLYTDFTYYSATTFDQIVNAPIPPATGFSYLRTNIGEVSNKGFELVIGGTPIQRGEFYWDASFLMAKNKNTLVSFIEGTDTYVFSDGTNNMATVVAKVGGAYGDIYGRDYVYHDGKLVVDAQGLPVLTDENVLLGNYQPDVTGGFNNSIGYKGLLFTFLIDFKLGYENHSWTEASLNKDGTSVESLQFREGGVLDAVVNVGTAEAPVYEQNTQSINSRDYYGRLFNMAGAYMKDMSHARLREVTLGYSFPHSILQKTFIQNMSLSLVGRNLFFLFKHIDSADPEATNTLANDGQGVLYFNAPSTRSVGFNLNISF